MIEPLSTLKQKLKKQGREAAKGVAKISKKKKKSKKIKVADFDKKIKNKHEKKLRKGK